MSKQNFKNLTSSCAYRSFPHYEKIQTYVKVELFSEYPYYYT